VARPRSSGHVTAPGVYERVAGPWHQYWMILARNHLPTGPGFVEGGASGRGQAATTRALDSCQGVRMRGPPAVIAIVNSKWAATEPSCE
jgi:hypothetical protein